MIIESLRSEPLADGRKRGKVPATCTCGWRGRFRLYRTGTAADGTKPASAQCETCGGWESMSTITCYAVVRQRHQQRTIGRFVALSALMLAALAATTLATGALDHLRPPSDPFPRALTRAA